MVDIDPEKIRNFLNKDGPVDETWYDTMNYGVVLWNIVLYYI